MRGRISHKNKEATIAAPLNVLQRIKSALSDIRRRSFTYFGKVNSVIRWINHTG